MSGVMLPASASAMRKSRKTLMTILALMLATASHSPSLAQRKHWREVQGRSLIKFDWNCASPSVYPKSKLDRLVATALRHEDAAEGMPDRAFAFDLNRDGRAEYFVPLVCGAVGNCTWGIFALGPARFLGTVNGQYLFVHKHAGHWPGIITYGHLSAMEGVLNTYVFRRGRYRLSGKRYPVGPEGRTLEIQNVLGRKMPRFLTKAHVACRNLGL
jgi:hypothetical protein